MKHGAPQHQYPKPKAQHRAFPLSFITTLEDNILLLQFKLIFLLRWLTDNLGCSYFPENSSGQGDVFTSSLTPSSNNHLCIGSEICGEIRTSIKDSWLIPAAGEDRWEAGTGKGGLAMEADRKCGQLGGEGGGTSQEKGTKTVAS